MNTQQAAQVLAPLAVAFHINDDAAAELWLEVIAECENVEAAKAATLECIREHEGFGLQPAVWRHAYMRHASRAQQAERGLPSGYRALEGGLVEYLTRFLAPAEERGHKGQYGDTLADWRKLAEKHRRARVRQAEVSGAAAFDGEGLDRLVEWFDNYDQGRIKL